MELVPSDFYIFCLSTMGKTYSKEEIIVAQNGAVEQAMGKQNTAMLIIAILLGVIISIAILVYCRYRIQHWIKKKFSKTSRPQTVAGPPAASYA